MVRSDIGNYIPRGEAMPDLEYTRREIGLCAERDRLKKELPGGTKGRAMGGRGW